MLFVDAKIRTERYNTCEGCEHFVSSTKSCGTLVTEAFTDSPLCGCYMPAKVKLKVASCPLGKWEATIHPEDVEQIREYLDRPNSDKTIEELNDLSRRFLTGQKASGCSSCNRKLLQQLKDLVHNADSHT